MAEEGSSRGGLKRSFVEDDDSSKPLAEKRVRFPKGKKVKQGDHVAGAALGDDAPVAKDPSIAARNRAVRRSKFQKVLTEEYADAETFGFATDVRKAEFQYQDNEEFIDEGVPLEPFNLEQEREEGYFDDNGNYVEYMNKQIKDAWLDGVDLCENYVEKRSTPMNNDEKPHDLSTEELAVINRRIADALEPGETVLRALRRLKGSTDKRQKMSAETKNLFDQLTEDAMKLMENGDYNVYDEKQEHFEREADGYEKLVNARKHGLPEGLGKETSEDMFDMFGDDEGKAADTPATTGNGSFSVQAVQGGEMQNDYVYDESSGYYYNSNLGYYYDPSTGLYGCAATGKWYSYNEESGAYDEIQQDVDANAAGMS
ncbi:hypothetical protein SASPL_132189 [Salvia splendens]|uniref:OCRE domain-containing protein n=1 Tax=Salvia splendens TaxID=180675 RepID=A0A8X8X789_SALSN|nr:CD2 antigen cytoplasmic tail-binding protein 2-like isoform X1 [Salvia splendens]KAG6409155.1 hypothetical protein SASPL_132189 [Salvia splendens]